MTFICYVFTVIIPILFPNPLLFHSTYYCLMKRKNLAWRPLQGQIRGSSLFYLKCEEKHKVCRMSHRLSNLS